MATGGQTGAASAAAAVSAVHALGAGSLLRRAVGEGALELEHGAADLVLERRLALLVVDDWGGVMGAVRAAVSAVGAGRLGVAAAEETSPAAAGGGGSAAGSERHVGGVQSVA